MWAHGGVYTYYVTYKTDNSDRYNTRIECTQHKYGKQPPWMFYSTIIDARKGPAYFWEKVWGSTNSTTVVPVATLGVYSNISLPVASSCRALLNYRERTHNTNRPCYFDSIDSTESIVRGYRYRSCQRSTSSFNNTLIEAIPGYRIILLAIGHERHENLRQYRIPNGGHDTLLILF